MALNLIKNTTKSVQISYLQKRWLSSSCELQKRASELFTLEKKRQLENIGRIEKIEVRYLGNPKDTTLIMNKGISTPYDCAKHIGEKYTKISQLALLDSNVSWDMHRPLQETCTLQLLNFKITDPNLVNRAFWRSCSFILGAVLQNCFKDEAGLQLHSFPVPNIKSGSFVYDISLDQKNWKPSKQELRTISLEMVKIAQKNLQIERLEISKDLALEMFDDNSFKTEQIPNIAANNSGQITVYRVGDHVDISKGPMVSMTSCIGRSTITAVHEIPDNMHNFYRVQGVALPSDLIINHFAWGILEDRARKMNTARLPNETYEEIPMVA